jgi:exodeoxyribonuclease-3
MGTGNVIEPRSARPALDGGEAGTDAARADDSTAEGLGLSSPTAEGLRLVGSTAGGLSGSTTAGLRLVSSTAGEPEGSTTAGLSGSTTGGLSDSTAEGLRLVSSTAGELDGSANDELRGSTVDELRVVSWNVNGIRARWPRLIELLTCERPDVVCLQETRCPAGRFPHERLRDVGYESRHSAGKNRAGGVAILVRCDHPVGERFCELDDHRDIAEGRWIELSTEGVTIASVYVPAGADRDDDHDHGKLAFLEAVARQAYGEHANPMLIAGDFNVAPTDQDIYEPSWFEGSYQTGAAERADLRAILDEGELVDVYRRLHPDDSGYTCWDQRQGHYGRDYGLRIDLMLASDTLAPYVADCEVNHAYRRGHRPSDHAPLDVTLRDLATCVRRASVQQPLEALLAA